MIQIEMTPLGLLQATRDLAYMTPPCGLEEHDWKRFGQGDLVLWILCGTCGTTPLEVLQTLTFKP